MMFIFDIVIKLLKFYVNYFNRFYFVVCYNSLKDMISSILKLIESYFKTVYAFVWICYRFKFF